MLVCAWAGPHGEPRHGTNVIVDGREYVGKRCNGFAAPRASQSRGPKCRTLDRAYQSILDLSVTRRDGTSRFAGLVLARFERGRRSLEHRLPLRISCRRHGRRRRVGAIDSRTRRIARERTRKTAAGCASSASPIPMRTSWRSSHFCNAPEPPRTRDDVGRSGKSSAALGRDACAYERGTSRHGARTSNATQRAALEASGATCCRTRVRPNTMLRIPTRGRVARRREPQDRTSGTGTHAPQRCAALSRVAAEALVPVGRTNRRSMARFCS